MIGSLKSLYGGVDGNVYNDANPLDLTNGNIGIGGPFGGLDGVDNLSVSSAAALTTNSGSTGSTATAATTVTQSTTSPFKISINWDSSVSSAPAAFKTAVTNAVTYLEGLYSNAVSVVINVGYGEVGGTALSSGELGQSSTDLMSVSYASLLTALSTHNTDATTASVLASLPAKAPVSGTIWISTAQGKALGLSAASGMGTDGSIGFSATAGMTYNSTTIAANTYDFNGIALHELTEVLGRIMFDGGTVGGSTSSYSLLDLLHFSAAGTRDLSATTPGYFSVDDGKTNGGTFNTVSGGDPGDWASTMGANALDAFSSPGVVNAFTAGDVTEMNALGWTLTGPAPASVPAPTGVSIAPATSILAALQSTSGLNSGKALLAVTETGGTFGDSFTYKLGGSAASAFVLNNGTLSTGSAALGGAANGKLYALTVTATDTTSGASSVALPLDVIVGSSGTDTVSVAKVVGSGSVATPTFIYGLGGNDTLNGSGMTGNLWFAGGAGGDTMTGGTGSNDYMFGGMSDSTPKAMDIIANFNAAQDKIDLTGAGTTALSYVGLFIGTKIAANSIGYQTSGGNTLVYANLTGAAVALTGASMEIELKGIVALTGSDFLHH